MPYGQQPAMAEQANGMDREVDDNMGNVAALSDQERSALAAVLSPDVITALGKLFPEIVDALEQIAQGQTQPPPPPGPGAEEQFSVAELPRPRTALNRM